MVVADLIREYPTVFPTPEAIHEYGCWETLVSFIYNLSSESRWANWAQHSMRNDQTEEEMVAELNRGGDELFAMLGVQL